MLNSKSLFIGPYGENKEDFLKLLNQLIEDVVQWRRNFHPEDDRLITKEDQRQPDFLKKQDEMHAALDMLLSEMKQSTPFHSPRFLGHMHADLLMPAFLGYFSGMLFNQNNVVGESSPITTRKEMEFSAKVCEMVGYQPYGIKHEGVGRSWSHLSSGGTTAILESMWLARNMKYYPLSLKLLSVSENEYGFINELQVIRPNGSSECFKNLSAIDLFNLKNEDFINLRDSIIRHLASQTIPDIEKKKNLSNQEKFEKANKDLFAAIDKYSVQHMGVQGIHEAIRKIAETSNELPLPLIFISTAAHYSWQKNLDIIGIGKAQVIPVLVDQDFKMDLNDLKTKLNKYSNHPVLMVVTMLSTTEEGAVDPIDSILKIKNRQEAENNKSFFVQVDGAWGGYFCAMLHQPKDRDKIKLSNGDQKVIDSLQKDLEAVRNCDAIVIDPHKMGYIPYAVGSISYKDTRYKDFIYKGAPYLDSGSSSVERTYLGGWTLEGSRSGAAALACALSAEVLPLDLSGYGQMSLRTINSTKTLYEAIENFNSKSKDIKILPAFKPQTNILCFVVSAPSYIQNPKYLNQLNNAVYAALSIQPDRVLPDYNFVTSKTELGYKNYSQFIENILTKAYYINGNFNDDKDFELSLLRTVILHQNIEDHKIQIWDEGVKKRVDLFDGFLNEIAKVAREVLPAILMESITKKKKSNERLKVLWIEDKPSFETIQKHIETESQLGVLPVGRYMDITFYNCKDNVGNVSKDRIKDVERIIDGNKYDFTILDLNLTGGHKEQASGHEMFKLLYSKEYKDAGIPIIFSKFFDEADSEMYKAEIKSIKSEIFRSELQFLHKEIQKDKSEDENEILAVNELVKRFYQLLQIP